MITLLASLAGFISSIFPELLKIFKDRYDKKHHLDIIDRQIKIHKKSFDAEEFEHANKVFENNSMYPTDKSGITWVDALNGSVRPVLAYSFFLMYMGIKLLQYLSIKGSLKASEYVHILWSIDDQAIFAGIISFYFGQRTFSKIWKKR